jgi:hypothetical protein
VSEPITACVWHVIVLPGLSRLDLAADDQIAYRELVAKLQHEGFIQKSSTNGPFTVVNEGRKVTDARLNYIDPLAHISDYVRTKLIHKGPNA